jgi:hypothetical protein
MATGQTLLDTMELLDQELQLQPGEASVTRGLTALNRAQDHFESLLAVRKGALGGQVGQLVTANATETTAFPAGVLRIDRLSMLSGNGGLPLYDLLPNKRSGTQANSGLWPWAAFTQGTGKPAEYKTNGRTITWSPLPSGVFYIRWEGFEVAADISAAGTFAYPDIVILPLASFAVKMFKFGIDDASADLQQVASETFKSTLDALTNFDRDGARGFEYTSVHTE